MNTQCNQIQLNFQGLGARKVVGSFDGGAISFDAWALLLREVEAAREYLELFSIGVSSTGVINATPNIQSKNRWPSE